LALGCGALNGRFDVAGVRLQDRPVRYSMSVAKARVEPNNSLALPRPVLNGVPNYCKNVVPLQMVHWAMAAKFMPAANSGSGYASFRAVDEARKG